MFRIAIAIFAKDCKLILARGGGIIQAMLLGLLLIFLFSLSLETGSKVSPQTAATMFWLASAFSMVLIFNMLYSLEEANSARSGLILLPGPVQAIWLGKGLGGFLILLLAQCVFFPACIIFLGQDPSFGTGGILLALAGVLAVDIGLSACGGLLGALAVGQSGRESLLSIVIFPILIPPLLAGISLLGLGFTPQAEIQGAWSWLGLALAFDAVFLGLGLFLYPYVYSGDI